MKECEVCAKVGALVTKPQGTAWIFVALPNQCVESVLKEASSVVAAPLPLDITDERQAFKFSVIFLKSGSNSFRSFLVFSFNSSIS